MQAKSRHLRPTLRSPYALMPRRPGNVLQKTIPRVRRFWFLPPIDPPYPAVTPREPMVEPETYMSICVMHGRPRDLLYGRVGLHSLILSVDSSFDSHAFRSATIPTPQKPPLKARIGAISNACLQNSSHAYQSISPSLIRKPLPAPLSASMNVWIHSSLRTALHGDFTSWLLSIVFRVSGSTSQPSHPIRSRRSWRASGGKSP